MTRVGYSRVSTQDQHPEAQSERLRGAGCEKIFTDHGVSGKLASRPQWDKCLEYLRQGDTLVTVKLDRIGRSLPNLLEVVTALARRGINLDVLDQKIDTSTPAGKLTFHIFAALAEFERDLIRERTMDGLAAARARGSKPGRPSKMDPDKVAVAQRLIDEGQLTLPQIANIVGVDRTTLYRHVGARQARQAPKVA